MRILLYQDNEKSLFKQGDFFILFERTPTIEFNQGGTGKLLYQLPDWFKVELRNQKIDNIIKNPSK